MGLFDKFKRGQAPPASTSPTTSADPFTNDEEKKDERLGSLEDLPTLSLCDSESDYAALDVITDMLYRTCWPLGWMPFQQVDSDQWMDEVVLGISIRSDSGAVRSCPPDHEGLREFEDAVSLLNAECAMKFTCRAVEYMNKYHVEPNPELFELCLDANTRIQILDTVAQLSTARKNQYAAFVREECVLVCWADHVEQLIPTARRLEETLVSFIWVGDKPGKAKRAPLFGGVAVQDAVAEKAIKEVEEDPEKAAIREMRRKRPVQLITPVTTGLAVGLTTVLLGLGIRSLLIRYLYDGDWTRFFLVFTLPVAGLLASFPATVLITAFVYILGPISHYSTNSFFYSAVKPDRSNPPAELPSITIQMPVYKEDLDDVIKPTIESLKVAITTFERQGGSVNIIMCEDGLQLVSENDRAERIKYYNQNNIGYVARPPHGQDGYLRRGKFKKAGNLNHCNRISLEIEGVMHKLRPVRYGPEGEAKWSELDEQALYREVVEIVRARYERMKLPTLIDGNVRIGDIILLIDSDTRVPEDCFMDAALEMTESPQVAIIQHVSGVMQVAHHFFENGMAFFTRMLQIGISMTAAGGDVAPFVGHNAFLRWSALQECAFVDEYDGLKRVWSESHVSEDFQIALNVQTKGWVVRWATYSNNGFEEGVSLTAIDELSRWQKYAWGCSEIIFNPIKLWFRKGIFTPLFKTFIRSSIPTHSKFGIMAYMFSYYAFSSAWVGTVASFILVGVFVWADTFYVDSWQTFFVCVLLFQGLNNVAMCILRYRLGMPNAGSIAIKQLFVWPLFFTIFFSGLSIPIAVSLIAHPLGIDMSWGTTSKSVEKSNFWKQLPKIIKAFWFQLTVSFLVLVGMIITTTSIMPVEYRVNSITTLIPMSLIFGCHFIWPFVLDPYLTTFSY